MSRSFPDDEMDNISDIATKNPKVDAKKVSEVRELLRVLRAQGITPKEYNLIPPFRRQMRVDSKYGKTED